MSPMSKYLWKLYFSEKLDPAQSIPDRVSVVNARRIDQITAVPNGNQTYRVGNDDVVVNTWRLSWDFSGVVGFDISYSINGGAPVVVATNYSRSNYIFPFTSSVESHQTIDTIRFIVKSSADPVAISTISKSYSVDCTASGVETVTDKNIVHDSSTIRISVDANDGSVVNIVNDYISELLPRDKYSVTIKKELLDDRGVTFNDFADKTMSWSVLDDLRIVTTNIHPGVLADPNDVVIRFNRELDVFTMAYYCSNTTDYVIIPATEYKMRIIDDVVSISMSGAYGEYKNYKLMINSAVDYNGNGLRRSAEIEFHSNHVVEPPIDKVYLQDIDNLRNNLSANLTMTQDLDFNDDASYDKTDVNWQTKKTAWTTGSGFPSISGNRYGSMCYSGTFDGNGFTIKNIKLYQTGEESLFGIIAGRVQDDGNENWYYSHGGVIKNLTTMFSTLTVNSWGLGLYHACLVSACYGTVLNCNSNTNLVRYLNNSSIITETITPTDDGGGGTYDVTTYSFSPDNVNNSIVSKSYSDLDLSIELTGWESIQLVSPNLVGRVEYMGIVDNCYIKGNVFVNQTFNENGENYGFGSIADVNEGIIRNSYSSLVIYYNILSVRTHTYGLYVSGTSLGWENSYYNRDLNANHENALGTPKTTAEMKQQATYTGWDFNTIWQINEGVDYPTFIPPYEPPTTD